MKNIYLLIVVSIVVILTSCEKIEKTENKDVSYSIIRSVVNNFINGDLYYDDLAKTDQSYNIDTIYASPDSAIFIAEISPTGYVIVSSTYRTFPIIGHSSSNQFSYMPGSTFGNWIDSTCKDIIEIKSFRYWPIDSVVQNVWLASAPELDDEVTVQEPGVFEQKGPYCYTQWGQGCTFNGYMDECNDPDGECGKNLVGCVNVAIGIIAKYHEKPTTYQWSYMTNGTTGSNETQRLLADIAFLSGTLEGCFESLTTNNGALYALTTGLGYNSSTLAGFDLNTIRAELTNSRPVYVSGVNGGQSTGHAWVCDGFNRYKYEIIHNPGTYYEYTTTTYSPTYLRMNWGWDGNGNGWYLSGLSSSYLGYNSKMQIIYNIH